MNLIDEIEISYFRSFYKFKLRHLKDLNIIFGKNDAGKSNVVRALNLFFSGQPDHAQEFDFETDFCHNRLTEANASEDVRKFLYVKITFNTPASYQRSLGNKFYVKRQWTVSRGKAYLEEFSSSIPSSRYHIARQLLNKIRFIYVPAIKDNTIFEMLLANIYETLANSTDFEAAVSAFTDEVQNSTEDLFQTLPIEISASTKIAPPSQMNHLFKTLDFETMSTNDPIPKSLTRQRGDGIKARHIPELLSFISENDDHDFHIWGFEEPENSLDFVAAQSEAARFLTLASGDKIQMFISTHSPSFYQLESERVEKCYVVKDEKGLSKSMQGRDLDKYNAETAIQEGFYLPAVAEALSNIAKVQARVLAAEEETETLRADLREIVLPLVLTEGRTDELVLSEAWRKLRGGEPPFRIRSCETGLANAGSGNGGVTRLSICLKGIASDNPNIVIGLYDLDTEGVSGWRLDRNFIQYGEAEQKTKVSMHGRAYAMLLPPPAFRIECARYQNLPIEYLFSDECLETEVDGRRLGLRRKFTSTKLGPEIIRQELENLTEFKDVANEKSFFAETIVPTFPPEEFQAFEAIFVAILEIIDTQA